METHNKRIMSMRTRPRHKVQLKILFGLVIVVSVFIFLLEYVSNGWLWPSVQREWDQSKYKLIVVVLSGPSNSEHRNVIRNTWLSNKYNGVKYFFAVGMLDAKPEERDGLKYEKETFKDLLLLPDLQDSYNTLTKKVLQSFVHICDNYEFEFLLKCDDDTFVLVDKVLRELEAYRRKESGKELYWGFFNGKAQVKRSGPWKETDWILCDYYLPYALGGGYILSRNLVKFIARNADILKIHNSEDVSVGLWLAPLANIERKHDVRFDTEYRSRGCSNEYIVTHKQSLESIIDIWHLYKTRGILCAKEIRNRMSYRYDWSVPPSQCCSRQSGIP